MTGTIRPLSGTSSVHSPQGHGSGSAEVINSNVFGLQHNLFVSLKCVYLKRAWLEPCQPRAELLWTAHTSSGQLLKMTTSMLWYIMLAIVSNAFVISIRSLFFTQSC